MCGIRRRYNMIAITRDAHAGLNYVYLSEHEQNDEHKATSLSKWLIWWRKQIGRREWIWTSRILSIFDAFGDPVYDKRDGRIESMYHPSVTHESVLLFFEVRLRSFFQLSVELSSAYLGIYSVNLYRIVQMDSTVEDLINSITYIYIFCITSVNQECAWWDAVPNFVSRNPPLHARLSSKHVVKHWPILSSYCFRCNFPLLWNTSNLISRILIFHTFPTLVNKIRLTRFFLIRLK